MGTVAPECRLPERCLECGQLIEPASEAPFLAGPLLVRPGARVVEHGLRCVGLTEQQFRILALLVKRGSARKVAIYEQVFVRLDGDGPDPKIVDVQVCKLRRALRKIGAEGVVRTVWGRGYAFDPDNESYPQSRSGSGRPKKKK